MHIPIVLTIGWMLAVPAGNDELEEARDRLRANSEAHCREGTEMCVRANSVPAVELLLEVLGEWNHRGAGYLPQAHYRDVVWDGLARVTDPYARQRVALEAEKSKSAWTRQWCLELVGEYGDAELGDAVLRGLRDKELGVQRAAARAAGRLRLAKAAKPLLGHRDDRDPILRANAIEALARLDPVEHRAGLVEGLRDKDAGVRCALLAPALEIWPEEGEAWCRAALADEDWRPRMQALDGLGTIRTKTAVDALIGALGDPRGALRARAVRRLQELTGQKHARKQPWEAWWKGQRAAFAFPDALAAAGSEDPASTVAYHGLPVESDHVAFLIDKSSTMEGTLASASQPKAEVAAQELELVLGQLEAGIRFNVYTYAEAVETLGERGPLELSARTAKRALEFVDEATAGGSKNIWQALETVLADPDIDTVFLLSSGEPEIGTYVHWNRVTWQLREQNRFRKLVVHTVVFSDSDWYREQLVKISEATGGEHRAFD